MMSVSRPSDLVQLLRNIEERSIVRAVGLPQLEESNQYWEGLVFSLENTRLLAPLNEVAEIMHFPHTVTLVPGTRPWVKGVANIRGSLLPIIDLQLFLGGTPVATGRRSRVLVVRHDEVFTGLLVQEVMGMRHFPRESRISFSSQSGSLEKYVTTAFVHENETWPVFDMFALAESPEFLMAAL